MKKSRLEAFSDGVMAIIITIMVLALKIPKGDDIQSLTSVVPVFLSYVLSYIYVGIYWNNHHHMLYLVDSISGGVLWANLVLLFWLSLIPFVTAWMGANHFSRLPVAIYGVILLGSAIAYNLLYNILARHCRKNSRLYEPVGKNRKGKISMVMYVVAIIASFLDSRISLSLYALVGLLWLYPDPRIENRVGISSKNHKT